MVLFHLSLVLKILGEKPVGLRDTKTSLRACVRGFTRSRGVWLDTVGKIDLSFNGLGV